MDDRTRMPDPRPEELLAAYELGLLDEEERRLFEAACREDADLLDELFDHAPYADALRADPARFAAAAAAAAPARPSFFQRLRHALRGPRLLLPVGVAAALAVILLSGGGSDLEKLAILEPLQVTSYEVRAGAPASDELYAQALTAYRDERWTDSAAGLQQALDQAPQGWPRQDLARLYLGSSKLLGGDSEGAEPLLDAAAGSPLAPVRERALWQLVQARLLRADETAARAALERLLPSPVYGDRAQALLEAMDAR
ncbi:MAG TPA: hypothetical protein P5571_11560 [Candidatus Krumholzibacteria bacterium]|nr:hypothetical protein [Candidatus Krumholzibacteria bacterium]HRX51995.1 hypothetical protein [Candidatus Krumholzibacteria bacterium]